MASVIVMQFHNGMQDEDCFHVMIAGWGLNHVRLPRPCAQSFADPSCLAYVCRGFAVGSGGPIGVALPTLVVLGGHGSVIRHLFSGHSSGIPEAWLLRVVSWLRS